MVSTLLIGFVIRLLGALAPGPTLAAAFVVPFMKGGGGRAEDICRACGKIEAVVVGSARGKCVLSIRQYRIILAACEVFLILFGAPHLLKTVSGW